MKHWSLFLPRLHCPHCGGELKLKFVGRWSLPRRKQREREGLDREGEGSPSQAVASADADGKEGGE